MTREHPRAGAHRRGGLFVMGGQVPEHAAQEDFPSDPPPAECETGNLPADTRHRPLDNPGTGDEPWWCQVCCGPCLAAAVAWDQAASAEPWQIDVTRTLEDTTRMGNGLSAAVRADLLRPRQPDHLASAVRLELSADDMRQDLLDGTGPGYPADYPTDPVDGAELDPVDGLPIGRDDDDGAQLVPEPLTAQGFADALGPVVPMTVQQARTTGGAAARILDWSSRHDPKSLEYGVRQKLRAPAPLMDHLLPHGPILDQGTTPPLSLHDASGCTGHAGVNAANVLTIAGHTGPADLPPPLGHADAMRLYLRAQELDDLPGEAYPGTSVLALMKAGQEEGLWSSYLWAFGTRDIAQALLQVGPVVIGIPWRSAMAEPGPDGIVTVGGEDLGGHALCLFGMRMAVAGRAGPWFGALQTWGEGVGDHGVLWFHHRDLAGLLHGVGEAAIPVPAGLLP